MPRQPTHPPQKTSELSIKKGRDGPLCIIEPQPRPRYALSSEFSPRRFLVYLPISKISFANAALGKGMETGQAQSRAFDVPISAHFLVLKIHDELDLAGADTLDRLAKSGKRNGACAEKRVDCGRAYMVEEIKALCG
jgi:hypothetical protein